MTKIRNGILCNKKLPEQYTLCFSLTITPTMKVTFSESIGTKHITGRVVV